MEVEKDIKIFLFLLYAGAYLLAVVPPNIIDPLLSSEAVPGPRHYQYSLILIPIGLLLYIILAGMLFRKRASVKQLYFSVCVFELAIIGSLWIFKPIPHGTPLQVGIITGFLSPFTIYIWSMENKIEAEVEAMTIPLGEATFEYLKLLFGFIRQGSFAGVALFSALLFGAFTTDFQYNKMTSTNNHDLFLLGLNAAAQVGFYVVFSVAGPLRYLFNTNLIMLSVLKKNAVVTDMKTGSAL
jgi:hypothetical protein